MSTGAADPPGSEFRGEIMALLQKVTGEDDEWLAGLRPDTRLDGDLLMDSLELAALSTMLTARHGHRVDLLALYADLDIDQIIALSVADVAAHVAAHVAAMGTRPATEAVRG